MQRPKQSCSREVDRVDFLRRTVRSDRQVKIVKGGPVELTPILKTDASARTVPLPDLVAEELARHHPAEPDGAIFHQAGQLYRRQRVGDMLHRVRNATNTAAAEADVDPGREPGPAPLPVIVRFHDLRHFYASLLIASAGETLDSYGHLWPDSDDQTRQPVDDVFAGPVARTRAS